ncbi:MAG: TRAP transporter small permease [Rubrivivax sp.]|nr:TRAP transporter small permease [Rubrivivax sp.]
MLWYSRALAAVRTAAAAWAVACFVIMTLAVWVQVGGRYFFNYSIASSTEVATLAQIWMVLVGAGIAARQDLHARIDALVNLFPPPLRRMLTAATSLLGLAFLAAVVVGAVPMLRQGQFQTTPTLGMPMWVPYLGLLVGPLYFAVEVLDMAVRQWRGAPGPAATDAL